MTRGTSPVSEIDDRMAEDRKRLALIRALNSDQRLDLLAYVNRRASHLVDEWLWDREADSTGTRYDLWGRAVIVFIGVAFALVVVLITLNPGGSLW
jgi:hypothetical protein